MSDQSPDESKIEWNQDRSFVNFQPRRYQDSFYWEGHPDWCFGVPCILVKERVETEWFDDCCDGCEGHEVSYPLPESEWFWHPLIKYVDMGDLPRLDDQPSSLLDFVASLKKTRYAGAMSDVFLLDGPDVPGYLRGTTLTPDQVLVMRARGNPFAVCPPVACEHVQRLRSYLDNYKLSVRARTSLVHDGLVEVHCAKCDESAVFV